MSKCCKENLSAYIDNELSVDEARKIEKHLQKCSSCERTVNEMRSIARAVEEMPRPEADSLLTMRIMSYLENKGSSLETPMVGLLESWGVLSLIVLSMMISIPFSSAFLRLSYIIYNKIILLITLTVNLSWRIPSGQMNNMLGILFMAGAITSFYGVVKVYWSISKKELAS